MRKGATQPLQKDCRRVRSVSGAFQGGSAEPGCQTSPKECIKIVENSETGSRAAAPKGLQKGQEHFRAGPQSPDAKRHPRNALR